MRFHPCDVLTLVAEYRRKEGGQQRNALPVLLVGCGPHTDSGAVLRLLRLLAKRAGSTHAPSRRSKDEPEEDQLQRFLASPYMAGPWRRVAVVRDLFDRDGVARPYLRSVVRPCRHQFVKRNGDDDDGDSATHRDDSATIAIARSVAGRDALRRRLVDEYALQERDGHYEYCLVQASVELSEYLTEHLCLPVILADDRELTASQLGVVEVRGVRMTILHPSVVVAKSGDLVHPWTTSKAPVASRTTNTVLMVAPIGFQMNPETAQDNHFMQQTREEAFTLERKALAEFSALHRALTSAGVNVVLHAAERHHNTPDAVFPNNWFSTHSAAESGCPTLMYYPMKTPSRRAERRQTIVEDLQGVYQRELTLEHWENADPPRFLESTGREHTHLLHDMSLLLILALSLGVLILDRVRKVAYAALSQRCSKRVALQWAKRTGYEVCFFRSFDQRGHRIYHTNVMMALGSSVAVVCLESVTDPVDREELESTLRRSHEIVEITMAQVDEFCGNVLELQGTNGKRILAMSSRAFAAFTETQKLALCQHTDELVHVPIDTIETIGGGGVRCMMAELF